MKMPKTKATFDNRLSDEKKTRKHRIEITPQIRRAIFGLAKMGHTLDKIADTVGVSRTFLKTHFQHEIKNGRELANALVTENIYQQAMKDSPAAMPAAMFIAKTRMGWGADEEKKNQNTVIFDFGNLSPEERSLLREQLIMKITSKNKPNDDIIEGEILDDDQEDNHDYVFADSDGEDDA
jgi:hypothetical protein